ncbi:very-short-patch-repair endonuclease [Meiothermus phage MMP17]|nr:DUF559 domain-containing protein [Meiothermus phage MMP7]QAY18082.1 very-short-patch-repair endonuclease [Meiothermus phage MMP17]
MADKTPIMSVEEYRALKKAGKLEQALSERYGKPKLEAIVEQSVASKGEETLAAHIRLYGLPEPERQFKFHSERRWRFDFAWPGHRLAVEVDGVLWGHQGGHQRPDDYADDCEKLNEAVLLGWRVLRFTPAQVRSGDAVLVVQRALCQE